MLLFLCKTHQIAQGLPGNSLIPEQLGDPVTKMFSKNLPITYYFIQGIYTRGAGAFKGKHPNKCFWAFWM